MHKLLPGEQMSSWKLNHRRWGHLHIQCLPGKEGHVLHPKRRDTDSSSSQESMRQKTGRPLRMSIRTFPLIFYPHLFVCFPHRQQMASIKMGLTVLPLFLQPSRPILGCLIPTNLTNFSSSIFGVNEMKQATATKIMPAPRSVCAKTWCTAYVYGQTYLLGRLPYSKAVYIVFLIQRTPTMNPAEK